MQTKREKRRPMRLPGYDYSQPGACFVTICTQGRACILSRIIEGQIEFTETGDIVNNWIRLTETHFPGCQIPHFVIMPNHLHAIVHRIRKSEKRGPAPALGSIVAFFKYQTTKEVNAFRQTPGEKLWQRNYYDHIIRNEEDYLRAREYIQNNPLKWELDELHPAYGR